MNYKSIAEIPETDLTMEQALAAMDALHPEAYARYSWMKLRRLLSIAAQGHHTPVFDDTPAFPMIRGRSVKVRQFGQDEFPKRPL